MGHVEEIMAKAGREAHSDRIRRLDRKQASAEGALCPVDPTHGKMGVHVSGDMLLCTFPVQKLSASVKLCNGHQSVGQSE